MAKDSRSFFERLTGAVKVPEEHTESETDHSQDHEENSETEPDRESEIRDRFHRYDPDETDKEEEDDEESAGGDEGTLSIDMYESANDLIVKTVIAGSRPEDLDISITRDKVSIRGKRTPDRNVQDSEIHLQELYWGPYSRSITLPVEVKAEEAEATAHYGILEIKLPKVNIDKETKLRVKTKQ